jgi:hypothetical protein
VLLLVACAGQRQHAATPAGRPQPLTVEQLKVMLDEGEAVGVILSRIESSGTVYPLTTEQRENLRAYGMPVEILSYMQLTYDRAIQRNPDLARSNDHWLRVGDYWYGGLPAGWPPEWVSP